jgi:hypothetical protein
MIMKTIGYLMLPTLLFLSAPGPVRPQTLRLEYSTYLGGASTDVGRGVALGSNGTVYVTGETLSDDFPIQDPYQASPGEYYDAFLSAFSPGGALLFSTYLGGCKNDHGYGISLGSGGTVYLTGDTKSEDFPTRDPYQASSGGYSDAFLAAFSPGGDLLFSTYLGGGVNDEGKSVSGGPGGTFCLAGWSESADFPTHNSYQSFRRGGADVFVAAFSGATELLFSTYLGGSEWDQGWGIAVDSAGAVGVTGRTESEEFPLRNPYQPDYGGGISDAFISRFCSSGSVLLFSTYLGGGEEDEGCGITIDSGQTAYLTGWTRSTDLPTHEPYQPSLKGGSDAFVCAFFLPDPDLIVGTYLGGSYDDWGRGVATGGAGMVAVTGETLSDDFPTKNPYQPSHGGEPGYDAFVTTFSTATGLLFSTYLGGSASDHGFGISAGAGTVAVTGETKSGDFPTRNSYQSTLSGAEDAFLSALKYQFRRSWITDYNGDGTSDLAVFRAASGLWAVRGMTRIYFGGSGDRAAPGDYDGDRTTEVAVFRAVSGLWAVRGLTRVYFGALSDQPVAGDYTGDGSRKIGIFRDSSGLWALRDLSRIYFGTGADTVAPGDYDGDGTWGAGIFRAAASLWAIRGETRVYFGSGGGWAVPADYDGDFTDDIGIFVNSGGLWAVRGISRIYFGGAGDVPVTR